MAEAASTVLVTSQEVRRLIKVGQWPEAVSACDDALLRAPENSSAGVLRSRALMVPRQFDEAMHSLNSIVDREPTCADAVAWQVAALSRQQRYDGAFALGREALPRLQNPLLVQIAMGRVLLDSSRPAEAIDWFGALDDPDLRLACWHAAALGQMYFTDEALGRLENLQGPAWLLSKVAFTRGRVHRYADNLASAVEEFRAALLHDNNDVDAASWLLASLRALNQTEEAMPQAEALVAKFPRSSTARVDLAHCLERAGDLEKSLEVANQAVALRPSHSWAQCTRISLLYRLRRFGAAEQAYAEASAVRPNDPDILLEQAWLLAAQHRTSEAIEAARRSLAADPRDSVSSACLIHLLISSSQYEAAQQAAVEALQHHPRDPDLHLAQCWIYNAQGRTDESLAAIEQVLSIAPKNSAALWSRIFLLTWADRNPEAHEAVQIALTYHPRDATILSEAARLLTAESDWTAALARADEALALHPTLWYAHESKIDALVKAKRYPEAHQALTIALEKCPHTPDAFLSHASLLSAEDKDDEAAAVVETLLKTDPLNPSGLSSRIEYLRYADRYAESAAAATSALAQRPDVPRIHAAAAWTLYLLDRDEEAAEAAQRALEIDPHYLWAAQSRIHMLTGAHRFDDAHDAVFAADRIKPDISYTHMTQAWLLSAQSREEEASEAAKRALRTTPDHAWALRSNIQFLTFATLYDEAELACEEALQLQPDEVEVHVAHAWLLNAQYRDNDAIKVLNAAPAGPGRNSWTLRSKIDLLVRARRFAEAQISASEALKQYAKDPNVHVTSGWMLSALGRYDDAIAAADQALALVPHHSWALRGKVEYLVKAGRLDDADRALTQAMKLRPGDPDIFSVQVTVLQARDQPEEALACIAQALAVIPRSVNYNSTKIDCLIDLRRFEEAEDVARAALALHPREALLHQDLSLAYEARRKFREADACLVNGLKHEPRSVPLHTARSRVLRALRRYREAQASIDQALAIRPNSWEAGLEQGWIHYDARRVTQARRNFARLLELAVNPFERAEAQHGLGWTAYLDSDFLQAAEHFQTAHELDPLDAQYQLALAWAQVRMKDPVAWQKASALAMSVADRAGLPEAYVCLGVIAFKNQEIAAAEYYLQQAIDIDPAEGSQTDLGSLYAVTGRPTLAAELLEAAIEKDWYDASAHIELGLVLIDAPDQLPRAMREFRQALSIEPTSTRATIALTHALIRAGDDARAESELRRVLQREDLRERWQFNLALARILVKRGDKQQDAELYAEAYARAVLAIKEAPDSEPDPHFVAGIANHRTASLTTDTTAVLTHRRRTMRHLQACLDRDDAHADALRNLKAFEREARTVRPAIWGGIAVATVSLILLVTVWMAFFTSAKVSDTMVTVTTPILAGLFTISVILPALIRLKLPGFEADLQASASALASGPTGEVTLEPGRFGVSSGPTGQISRRK